MVKKLPANAGDTGSIPDLGRFYIARSNKAHVPHLLAPIRTAWEPQLLSPPASVAEA